MSATVVSATTAQATRRRISAALVRPGSDGADRRPVADFGGDRHPPTHGVESVAHVHQPGARLAVGRPLIEAGAVVDDVQAPTTEEVTKSHGHPGRAGVLAGVLN